MGNYTEGAPENIVELVRKSRSKVSWKARKEVVEELGKWKCKQSVDVLQNLLKTDKVYSVQYAALQSLQNFGIHDARLPKKKSP